MQQEVVNECTGDLVSLSIVKKNLRIEEDFTEEDDLIQLFLDSACDYVENFIERPLRLITTIYTIADSSSFKIDKKGENDKLIKVESQNADAYESLDDDEYKVTETPEAIQIELPKKGNYKIHITSGYDEETIPSAIKQAILLIITESYDRRENTAAIHFSKANIILSKYRKWRV